MSQETTFDPSVASGESNYRGVRMPELNEVSLNGDDRDGGYFRKKLLLGKPKDQKPEEIKLNNGGAVTLVFLKIRRKLVERGRKGEILRSTSEHDSPKNSVTLFDSVTNEREHGVAEDLRKKYGGLRTVQIIYALLVDTTSKPELVKLIVKGASLGSEAKDKNTMDFYQYLSSFKGEEHFWQYKTILNAIMENGQRSYYAIDFHRGEKLQEQSLAYAVERMKEIHDRCAEVDTARAMRIVKDTTGMPDGQVEQEEVQEEVAAPDYPTEDINPEMIPF